MHKLLFIIAFVLVTSGAARAQDFDYTVTTDSVTWNELSTQTILNGSNSAWDFAYRIPIGFTFNFLGRDFDSLTVETNGYIVFDNDRNYALTAFSGVGDHVDSVGNHAVLGYELVGTAGNRILKIQYKNCGTSVTGREVMSWQVWLRENGNVEVRVGPGALRYHSGEVDTTKNYRIGLINMNMDTEERGIFIGGNPASPQTQPVNDTYPEVLLLNCIPAMGYHYTFSQL